MSDVVIGAQLQVDSGNSAPSVKQVRDQIKGLKDELEGATVGSKQHTEILGKLKTATDQLNPSVKEQGSTFSQVKDHLTSSIPAFKGASEGASGFGATLKALLVNPIVLLIAAIVAGLKFLYDAFKNSFEGGQKMEQVFAGLSAAATVVTDRVFALGRAIIKFFSGDFKGALVDAKAAVSGVGDEVLRVYNRTAELTKQLQGIRKEERADDLEKSEREKRLALLREQLNDESVPIAKRKAIAKELRDDQEQNAKDDLERAKRKAAIQIELYSQEKDGALKHADEINEINVGINKTETENALEGVRTNKVIRNLDKQERQEEAAKEKEERAKAKEERQKELAERRAIKENYVAFSDKITKLEQEDELATIQDGDAKKIKELQFALAEQKKLIERDFEDKKITGTQRGQLLAEIEKNNQIKINQVFAEAEKQRMTNLQRAIEGRKTLIQAGDLTPEQMKQRATLLRQLTTKETDIKLQDLQSEYNERLLLVKGNEDAELSLKQWYSDQKKQIDQAELDFKLQIYDQIGMGINALGGLFDRSTAAAKIAGLTEIAIGTGTGFIRALEIAQKSAAGTGPGAAFAFPIFYASQIAAVLGAASKAKSVLSSGTASATASASAPITPSAPLRPAATATSTTLDQNSINGIGNAAASKAYVLESDVTNNQEKVKRLNRAARLG